MKKIVLLVLLSALNFAYSANAQISIVDGNNLFSTGLTGTGSGVTAISRSIFLGEYAGQNAQATSSSVFIGNTTGSESKNVHNSIFLGDGAGSAVSQAFRSVYIGLGAGSEAKNGTGSNFIGASAGRQTQSTTYSNFMGFCAGWKAINAGSSNFLGFYAGNNATNASLSNFIGYSAGQGTTNASHSFLAGYNVGNENNSTIHMGSNNIIIGTNISLPNAATNSMNIGGVLYGTGFYAITDGSPSTAPCNTGKIGIGVVAPTATLDVAGNANISAGVNVGGNVGIGTTTPDQKLTVKGKIHAEEVIVDLSVPVADYVFTKDYALMPLHKVEQYVQQNSHLPDIPSAAEIKEQGLSMGEMQNKLLKKIEEQTLYIIALNKQMEKMDKRIKELETR